MRHRHGLRKFNCTSSHRKAKFMALCNALIEHGAITTTLPKAKSLRKVIEPLITLAAEPSVANKRLAFARLRSRRSVVKLFDEIGPRYRDRPGGYTRVLKKGFRRGDAAPMAFVELVGGDEELSLAAGRRAAAKPEAQAAPEQAAPAPAEPAAAAAPQDQPQEEDGGDAASAPGEQAGEQGSAEKEEQGK